MSSTTHGFRTGVYRTRAERPGNETSATGDGRTRSTSSLHRIRHWLLVGAAALYSWFAALTTPFTTSANVMTGAPLIVALVLAVLFAYRARSQPRGGAEATASRRALWPWWSIFGLIVAWELYCYFELPRYAHPTISSLYDSASSVDAVKAALFLGWLALGWAIVRSFGRARS